MSLNRDKCKILNVYRSKNPGTHQYTMNGVPLDTVTHHSFLGVKLSSNLNWSFHIENIIGKANRSFGFIRRNLYSFPESVESQVYLTLVRPCLEYACRVWDPHTQKHCRDIEGVQRRAARFVRNCYVREPGTVTNLLDDLNWHSLELRRKITRLATMYKIVNGKIAVIREVKHDVYGKRQTAKIKLLPPVFSSLYSRIKIFVFAVNSKRHFSTFV